MREWLAALLRDARAEKDESTRVTLLQEIILFADPVKEPGLAVTGRLELAAIHCARGRWAETFELFDESLRLHDEQPWHFDRKAEDGVLYWYAFIVDSMLDFPDVPLTRIQQSLDDVEQRLRAGERSLHWLAAARRRLALLLGDWDAEEEAWRLVDSAGRGDAEAWEWRIERLLLRGEPVMHDASVVMNGVVGARKPPGGDWLPVVAHLLLPLARAGRLADAVAAHRYVRIRSALGPTRYEYLAMRMEFCALTGNPDAAYDLLSLLDKFDDFQRPAGRMHFATAVSVLTGVYLRSGWGDMPAGHGTTIRLLHERMTTIATGLATEFDERNGTTTCSERIRQRLDAEPVVEFLALRPGSVPLVDVRPDPALDDSTLVALCRLADQRCETETARAALAAIKDVSGPLAGHVVEMRTRLHRDGNVSESMRWAIHRHRERGEETAALLAECWLGLVPEEPDGIAITANAAQALREGNDDEAAAWADLWFAYALARLDRGAQACAVVRRGAERAAAFPLTAGVLTRIEAAWRNQMGEDPAGVKALAIRAVKFFLDAKAGQRAIEAIGDLQTAHQRAGTSDMFARQVDSLIDTLPAGEMNELRGHLRGLKEPASLADLYDAHGQATARRQNCTAVTYRLIVACHAVGRYEEALELCTTLADDLMTDRYQAIRADCYAKAGLSGESPA